MPGPLKLEVFGADVHGTVPVAGPEVDDEHDEARLAAFETGYKAGWDDALSAEAEEKAALHAEVGRSLQAISFTYHEARTHILHAIGPLMKEIVTRILPVVGRAALSEHIATVLAEQFADVANAQIDLLINPATHSEVEAYLAGRDSIPLRIIDEPTLGTGQAWLRCGDEETRIDLDGAVDQISDLLVAFLRPALAETKDPTDV